MKKIIIIITLVALVLVGLVACTNNAVGKDINVKDTETSKTTDPKQTNNISENSKNSNKTNKTILNKDLKNSELLASIDPSIRVDLFYEAELVSNDGTNSKITTYQKGEDIRIEIVNEAHGNFFFIYNDNDKKAYHYREGLQQGLCSTSGRDEEVSSVIPIPDLSSISEDYDEEVTAFSDEEGNINIEIVDIIDDVESSKGKIVYSSEYNIVLVFELYINESLFIKYNVVNIDNNKKIDDNLFEAPKDIKFVQSKG